MKRTIIVILFLLLCGLPIMSNEKELDTNKLLTEEQIGNEVDDIIKKMSLLTTFKSSPYTYSNNKPHVVAGNTTVWITQNLVKADGWQITGYSWLRFNSKFQKSRLKIGLIGGELEAMRPIHDRNLSHLYNDEDRSVKYGIVLGIHFWKEF